MKIGFVGAGAMGRPMIRHLIAAGHELTVFVRNRETRAAIETMGARAADSPQAAATGADAFMTNVTRAEDVEGVLFGLNGAAQALAPGVLCIDFSTISPLAVPAIAERLSVRQIDFLDAPVSGGAAGAEAATLSIMVGGANDAFERARALLQHLGKTITYVGPPGAGQVAKACNQLVQVINIQGIAEAMQFAAAMKVDPDKVLQAISAGMAGSKMLDLMGPKMVRRDFAAGIEARLHAKDFAQTVAAAHQLGLTLPAAGRVDAQLRRLIDQGWGHDDTSSLLRVLETQSTPEESRRAGDPAAVVDRQMEAYNAHDLERFLPCYTDDVTVYQLPEGTISLSGKTAFAEFYRSQRFNRPELKYTIRQRIVIGDKVIDHEVIEGLEPHHHVEVVVIFEVRGGVISRMWSVPNTLLRFES